MKKVIIVILSVLIFAGLAVGCTAALIKAKNDENIDTAQNQTPQLNQTNKVNKSNNTSDNIVKVSNEKTIDLNGTYSENDLTFKGILLDGNIKKINNNFEIPQVDGLKDKEVQTKINNSIKNIIYNKVEDILKEKKVSELGYYDVINANFANVLSLNFYIYGNNGKISETIRLNYKLTDGEELKFEELFKQDADLESVVRLAIYRELAIKQRNENRHDSRTTFSDIYYDNEKEAWFGTYSEHDENGNIKKQVKEYIPPMSEYEIEKAVNKFLKQENKVFSFSPSNLEIEIDNWGYSVEFKDIAEEVVIYNKFLTKDSLYEKENIGAKSIITCSAERNFGKYKEEKYESNNFFYDICLQPYVGGQEYQVEEKYKLIEEKMEDAKNTLKNKAAEYKKIAKENPNKAYFLFSEFTFSEVGAESEHSGEIIAELKNKLIICDIKEKDDILQKILDCYRYYNINMYGTIYNYLETKEELKKLTTENVESKYYESTTGKEISTEKNVGKNQKDEIFPSSTRKLEETEVEALSKDQLSLAYNEIFARHGHDFKTKEYKDYFNSCIWYTPIVGKTVSLEELSEIERYNAKLIKSVIDKKS